MCRGCIEWTRLRALPDADRLRHIEELLLSMEVDERDIEVQEWWWGLRREIRDRRELLEQQGREA